MPLTKIGCEPAKGPSYLTLTVSCGVSVVAILVKKSYNESCQNTSEALNSQKTPHISPLRVSYVVSRVTILKKNQFTIMRLDSI